MRALVWNCRGAGSSLTVSQLNEFTYLHSPSIIFLCETKQKKKILDKVRSKISFDNCFIVDSLNKSGGMAMFWRNDVNVLKVQSTAFTIEMELRSLVSQESWWFIGIYASTEDLARRGQWKVIQRRKLLWGDCFAIAGDFNDILSNEEKWGGRMREEWTFQDFKKFVKDNELVDLNFVGQPWTWSNNWVGDAIMKQRLDRFFV
ncbi:hypothetical protein ACH5RR_009969 [Cinchona calisaya]|uniref:Endonuclease/exonuclease/phosphatase domain-containing protein n=1 Tax=Cinchona calisaya TaxID=153742 RepID=A0ABD3AHV3_9GENT